MNYESVKPFCHLYLNFIDDLIKVYPGKLSQEKLTTQRKWLLQGMLRKNVNIPETFMQSIQPVIAQVMAQDLSLFDPTNTSALKLGRLDWKIFSKETKFESLTSADQENVFKYLRSMLLTCQMLTGRMSMQQFAAIIQQASPQVQNPPQSAIMETPTTNVQGQGNDPFQAFLSNPAYAQLYANLERQLTAEAQRTGVNLNNQSELMGMVLSGKLDMATIMKDMSENLDAQIQSGTINKDELEAQANGIIGSMSGGLPPGLLSTLQSNPSALLSMLGGLQ